MQRVEDRLVAGKGVNRGHEAALDADRAMSTWATGARQLVVQEAVETTVWPASSPSWLTP